MCLRHSSNVSTVKVCCKQSTRNLDEIFAAAPIVTHSEPSASSSSGSPRCLLAKVIATSQGDKAPG